MANSHCSIFQYNGNQGVETIAKIDKDGDIYFAVYAYFKKKDKYMNKFLLMKLSEKEEKTKVRWANIYFTYMGGYRFIFPNKGEKLITMSSTKHKDIPNIWALGLSSHLAHLLGELDSRLIYLSKALEGKNILVKIQLITQYRKTPYDVEMLIKNNLFQLANTKKIYQLNKGLKKKVWSKIKENLDSSEDTNRWSINEWLTAVKYDIPVSSATVMTRFRPYPEIDKDKVARYLRKGFDEFVYLDYLNMARRLDKNLQDDYWAFPTKLYQFHDKLMNEINALKKIGLNENYSSIEMLSEQLREKFKPMMINGYQIDFPENIEDIIEQAKALSQCLITASYHKSMKNRELALIFIKKGEERVATVEIKKNLKVGQFYADESDRDNCLPSEEVKNAFEQFKKERLKGKNLWA